MVAIFSGAGAGFTRSSANLLGGAGQLGTALLGQGSENVSVNAATGNLLVSHEDEFLVGLGPDAAIGRTYNSLNEAADGDNGDQWQQSTTRRVFGLTGTLNTAGSTVSRLGADGAVVVYTWEASRNAYLTEDGAGAFDTLTRAGNTWTWRDGDSQATETYEDYQGAYWRITAAADSDGNALTFSYVAGSDKLDKVTTADGSWVQYGWTGGAVTSVVTGYTDLATSTAKTLTRVRYTYDGSGRLETVTTDLSPGDNSIADNAKYVISYTYDGTSKRIASISQSDGSLLQVAYDGSNRVQTLTQTVAAGVTRVTTLAYGADHTTVTGPDGQVTRLDYDASQRLTKISAPPAASGATAQTVQFSYDADGNLDTVTDGNGKVVSYDYDANGNNTLVTDPTGNTVQRTYDAANRLVTELAYGSDENSADTAQFSQYAYDAEGHLRFAVNAAGQVTEYRYTSAGDLARTIAYAEHPYAVGPSEITEAGMASWAAGLGSLVSVKITENTYDARGNLVSSKAYGSADAAGNPLTGDGTTTVSFVYDQAGKLLDRFRPGENHETFLYDGMGRLVSATDKNGGTTTIVFTDATNTTATTAVVSVGVQLTTTSVYNKAGELVSVTESGASTTVGTASYAYDSAGRLRVVTDASGKSSYIYYDKAGRKVADVNQLGEMVEYRYDAAGRIAATIAYSTALGGSALTTMANPTATADFATLRPTANAADVWTWTIHDDAGRVIQTIDNLGGTVTHAYDKRGRLQKTTAWFNKLSAGTLSGFKTTLPTLETLPSAHAKDTVSRLFYNKAGQLRGALDGEGNLTETVYDAAGQAVRTVAFATATTPSSRASGSFATLRGQAAASPAADRATQSIYDGQGLLRFTVNAKGGITGYTYDSAGRLTQTTVYATELILTDLTYDAVKSAISARPSDRSNSIVYDAAGRAAYTVDAEGGVTAYKYNLAGQVVKQVAYDNLYGGGVSLSALDTWAGNATQASDAANRITRNWHNARGETVYSLDAENRITGHTYDAEGRVTSTTRFGGTAFVASDSTTLAQVNTAATAVATADRITVTKTYDVAGRVLTVTTPIDNGTTTVTRNVYNALGQLFEVIEADNHTDDKVTTRYTYDGAGQILTVTEAFGVSGQAATTTYAYDALGNRISVTDARGNATSFTFDKLGRVVTATDANSNDTTYVYDAFDNVVKVTSPEGKATFTYYDSLDRAVVVRDAESYVTKTIYNRFGDVLAIQKYRDRATGTAQTGTLPNIGSQTPVDLANYYYDRLGRLILKVDAEGYVETTAYSAFGQVTKFTRYANTSFGTSGGGATPAQVQAAYDNAAALQITANNALAAANTAAASAATAAAAVPPLQSASNASQAAAAPLQTAANQAAAAATQAQDDANGAQAAADAAYTWAQLLQTGGAAEIAAAYAAADQAQDEADDLDDDATAAEAAVPAAQAASIAAAAAAEDADALVTSIQAAITAMGGSGPIDFTTARNAALANKTPWLLARYNWLNGAEAEVEDLRQAAPYSSDLYDTLALYELWLTEERAVVQDLYAKSDTTANLARKTTYIDEYFDNLTWATNNVGNDRASANAGLRAWLVDRKEDLENRIDSLDAMEDAGGYSNRIDNASDALKDHWGRAFKAIYDLDNNTHSYWGATGSSLYANLRANPNWRPSSFRHTNDEVANHRALLAVDAYFDVDDAISSEWQSAASLVQSQLDQAIAAADIARDTEDAALAAANVAAATAIQLRADADEAQDGADVALAYAQQLEASLTDPDPQVVQDAIDAAAAAQTAADAAQLLADQAGATSAAAEAALAPALATAMADLAALTAAQTAANQAATAATQAHNAASAAQDNANAALLAAQALEDGPPGGIDTSQLGTASETRFEYERRGLLTKTTDAQGWYESFTYDSFGQRATQVAKNFAKETTAAGGTTTYLYDKRGLLVAEILPVKSYNIDGNAVSSPTSTENPAGNIRNNYVYDKRGNLTQKIEAAGLSEERVTTYTYDKLNRRTATIGESVSELVTVNASTKVMSDFSSGNPTESIAYDLNGNVIRITDPAGGRTVFFYDKLNRKTVEINAVGTYTLYTYDADGNVTNIKIYEGTASVPTNGGASTAAPAAPSGNRRETAFAYDNIGRLLTSSVLLPSGYKTGTWNGSSWTNATTASLDTTYQYDHLGNVVKVTDPNGNATFSYYDKLSRKTGQLDAQGYFTSWAYTSEGNVANERRFFNRFTGTPSTSGPPSLTMTWDDRYTEYTYDKVGNRIAEHRFFVKSHAGNGNHTSGASANIENIAKIRYTYNGLGQVVQKDEATDFNSLTSHSENNDFEQGQLGDQSFYYLYDAAGRLIRETRPVYASNNGNVTPRVDYAYNGLGDLTRTAQAAGGDAGTARVTKYIYGAGGRLTQTIDADNKSRHFYYDVAGRLTRESFNQSHYLVDGGIHEGSEGTGYWYDALGRSLGQGQYSWTTAGMWEHRTNAEYTKIAYNAFGDVVGVATNRTDGQISTKGYQQQNQYDLAGRLVATNAGDGIWKYFGYDKNGNQTVAITSAGEAMAGLGFTGALSKVGESDVNATYTVYDKRNQANSVVEEGRELSATATQTLITSRTYNAFGDVATETDALNNVTSYTYNTMGRMIRKEGPTVSITLENGTTQSVKPAWDYYYDKSGRLVATRDANGTYSNGTKSAGTGNLTLRTLLAGTGYGGSEALVAVETRADGGTVTNKYNIFGDLREITRSTGTSAGNLVTTQTFDNLGRLTSVANTGGATWNFEYDILGQQTKSWNSVYGSGDAEITEYDWAGRITAQRTIGGDVTRTTYAWNDGAETNAIGEFGGWIRSVTGEGYTATYSADLFGRDVVAGKDYDAAGRLATEDGFTVAYFNTGLIKSKSNVTSTFHEPQAPFYPGGWFNTGQSHEFSYDELGRLKTEKSASYSVTMVAHQVQSPYGSGTIYLPTQLGGVFQDGQVDYDALGRITRYRDGVTAGGTLPVDKNWTYDAEGNVRSISTTYRAMLSNGTLAATAGAPTTHWYRYDSMNRVVISQGGLSGGMIVADALGVSGIALAYDQADRRVSSKTGSQQQENYTLNAQGLVTQVEIGGVVRVTTSYDLLGRINGYLEKTSAGSTVYERYDFTYNSRNQVLVEKARQKQGSDWIYSHTVNHYNDAGANGITSFPGSVTSGAAGTSSGMQLYYSRTKNWKSSNAYPASTPSYGGDADDNAPDYTSKTFVAFDRDQGWRQTKQDFVNKHGTGTSTYSYGLGGALSTVNRAVTGGVAEDIRFLNDISGQVVERRETHDSGGGANLPITRTYRFGGQEMGHVTNDSNVNVDYATLIARRDDTPGTGQFLGGATTGTPYANFDANHITLAGGAQDNAPGSWTVRAGDTLQSIAMAVWGDASQWYKLALANGATDGAIAEGQTLVLPGAVGNIRHNAETIRPYDPTRAMGDVSPPAAKPPKQSKNCGVFGMILIGVIGLAVAVISAGALAAASIAAVGGGNVGLVGGLAALGGAAVGTAGATLTTVGMVAIGAASAALGSIASQGFGVATGLQDKFSWKGVALAALSGGVSGGLSAAGSVFGKIGLTGSDAFVAGARGALSNVAVQGVAVATGLQGKFDWAGVAAAGIGSAVGYAGLKGLGANPLTGPGGSNSLGNHARHLGANMASLLADAATRSAINGDSFGDNVRAALPNVIGQAVVNALQHGVSLPQAQVDAEPVATGGGGGFSRPVRDSLPYKFGGSRAPDRFGLVAHMGPQDIMDGISGAIGDAFNSVFGNWGTSSIDEIAEGAQEVQEIVVTGYRQLINTLDGWEVDAAVDFRIRDWTLQAGFRAAVRTPVGSAAAGGVYNVGAWGTSGAFAVRANGFGSHLSVSAGGGLTSSGIAARGAIVGNVAGNRINASGMAAVTISNDTLKVHGAYNQSALTAVGVLNDHGLIVAGGAVYNGNTYGAALAADGDHVGVAGRIIASTKRSSESWGQYLTRLKGPAPQGMINPHAHHIVFQKGNGPTQQALVVEAHGILREVGIDPINGPENLIWAPSRIKEQHAISTLRPLVEDLRVTQGSRADIEAILRYHGELAQNRR